MTEQTLQKKICDYLKSKGAYCIITIINNRAGVPDIVGSYNGKFFGFEVKLPETSQKLTTLQKENLYMIKEAGGIGYMVTSVDEVKEIVCLNS